MTTPTTTTRLTLCLATLSGGLASSDVAPKLPAFSSQLFQKPVSVQPPESLSFATIDWQKFTKAPTKGPSTTTITTGTTRAPTVQTIDWKPEPTPMTAVTTGTRLIACVADEDCLQHPGLSDGCPQFCNDGFCGPRGDGSPPVLRLRTGIKVDTSRFKLREDEELERVFENPPEFFPKGMLDGRFFEVAAGANEVLEVKYPKDFFATSAKLLESSLGSVDGDKDERPPKQGDHEDLDGDLDAPSTSSNLFGAQTFDTFGTAASYFGDVANRRGLAIQGDAPDRWHPSNTASNPWRRNGRLSMGCTAALIGNRVLVTAAHCVWDRATNSWGSFPTFAAGQDGTYKPYGDVRVVRMTIPAGYQTCSTSSDCRAHDWAVLAIHRHDRLNVGYFGFSTSKGNTLNLAGYPQSKNRELWYDSCPLHSDEGKWIKHRCDTEPGNSGSGIYKITNGKRYVVAIHGGGYTDLWNRGADVDGRTSSAGRLYDRMLAYRREFG
jgi:V8-like Glu-specific endopeptidase